MTNTTEYGTVAVGAPNSVMRKITQYPEVSTPPSHSARTNTPWGQSQSATSYAKGLIFYDTPSHGGYHVTGDLLKRIPPYMQSADRYADGTAGWFEEDCASAIVTVCLPEFFPMEWRLNAIETMRHFYAPQWERFCQEGGA